MWKFYALNGIKIIDFILSITNSRLRCGHKNISTHNPQNETIVNLAVNEKKNKMTKIIFYFQLHVHKFIMHLFDNFDFIVTENDPIDQVCKLSPSFDMAIHVYFNDYLLIVQNIFI